MIIIGFIGIMVLLFYLGNAGYIFFWKICLWDEKAKPFPTKSDPDGLQEHAGFLFKIATKIKNEKIEVRWEFKESIRKSGFRLIRFRKTDAYSAYPASHICGYDNGQTFDSAEEGSDYYYKFQIQRDFFALPPLENLVPEVLDEIEFSIKAPASKNVKQDRDAEMSDLDYQIRKIKKEAELADERTARNRKADTNLPLREKAEREHKRKMERFDIADEGRKLAKQKHPEGSIPYKREMAFWNEFEEGGSISM